MGDMGARYEAARRFFVKNGHGSVAFCIEPSCRRRVQWPDDAASSFAPPPDYCAWCARGLTEEAKLDEERRIRSGVAGKFQSAATESLS
jgi:hypothetical protein